MPWLRRRKTFCVAGRSGAKMTVSEICGCRHHHLDHARSLFLVFYNIKECVEVPPVVRRAFRALCLSSSGRKHRHDYPMRVNAELILQMRRDKAWSQEELAIAAGLNLRTIQRIERGNGVAAIAEIAGVGIRREYPCP